MKSESEAAQSRLTLSDPMDCSLPGFSVHGIFQARVLEWSPLPSPIKVATMKEKKGGRKGMEEREKEREKGKE